MTAINNGAQLEDVDRREFAKTLLTVVLDKIAPMPAEIKRQRNGSVYLLITIQNSGGNAKIEYDPLPAIESLIEVVLLRNDLLPVQEVLTEEVCSDLQISSPGQWLTDFLVDLVIGAIDHLLTIAPSEFGDAVRVLPALAMGHVQAIFAEVLRTLPAKPAGLEVPNRTKLKAHILSHVNKGRVALLDATVDMARQSLNDRAFDLPKFVSTHISCHSRVADAKAIYIRNKLDKAWRTFVLAKYPDMPLPLIERLASDDPYTAAPNSIALEWAARLCGASDDQFSTETLYLRLKQSKQLQQDSPANSEQ